MSVNEMRKTTLLMFVLSWYFAIPDVAMVLFHNVFASYGDEIIIMAYLE